MAAQQIAEQPQKLALFTMFAFITLNVNYLITPCCANSDINIPEGGVIHLNFSFSYNGFGLIELKHNTNNVFVRNSGITQINSRTPLLLFNTSDGITSFTITDFASSDNGQYICVFNKEEQDPVYDLSVILPPQMKLKINGKDVEDNSSVLLSNEASVTLQCFALNAKPAVNILWVVSKEPYSNETRKLDADFDFESHSTENTSCQNHCISTSSTINYLPNQTDSRVICYAGFSEKDKAWNISFTVSTYDFPQIQLDVNATGNSSNGKFYIQKNERYRAECSIPSSIVTTFAFSWESNGITIKHNSSMDNSSTVTFSLDKATGYLTCILTGPHSQTRDQNVDLIELFFNATAVPQDDGNNEEDYSQDNNRDEKETEVIWPVQFHIVLIVFSILVVSIVLFSIVWKRISTIRTRRLFANGRTSVGYSTHLAMSSRELPVIQTERVDASNIGPDTQQEIVQNKANEKRCLCAEDVQFSYQLPGKGTVIYWVATVSSSDFNIDKVIAKSVSENARMKEAMNFRALAKNVITLPKHPNIVDVLGVSLEDVPYLIYLEYIDYGTLKDFLMRNYQQSSSGSSNKDDVRDYDKTLQLTTFAFDICQGMLFLDKQSYRHPALSARKALLSSRGQCKLYDFWPVDVANDAVNQLLEQKIPPIAWLPPETVFIGQYSEKSDIWSFGVVVWEIFSLGETPFGGLTCAEIEGKLRRKQYLEQPRACAGGIFGTMLSMWNPSVNERPSFSSLCKTLQAFLNDMKKNINERCEEEPNYFSLDKDSSDDDYIEHV